MQSLKSRSGASVKDFRSNVTEPTTIVIQNNINRLNYCLQPTDKVNHVTSTKSIHSSPTGLQELLGTCNARNKLQNPTSQTEQPKPRAFDLNLSHINHKTQEASKIEGYDSPVKTDNTFGDLLSNKKNNTSATYIKSNSRQHIKARLQSHIQDIDQSALKSNTSLIKQMNDILLRNTVDNDTMPADHSTAVDRVTSTITANKKASLHRHTTGTSKVHSSSFSGNIARPRHDSLLSPGVALQSTSKAVSQQVKVPSLNISQGLTRHR